MGQQPFGRLPPLAAYFESVGAFRRRCRLCGQEFTRPRHPPTGAGSRSNFCKFGRRGTIVGLSRAQMSNHMRAKHPDEKWHLH